MLQVKKMDNGSMAKNLKRHAGTYKNPLKITVSMITVFTDGENHQPTLNEILMKICENILLSIIIH